MQIDRSYPTAIRSVGEFRDAHFTSAVSLPKDMSQEGFAPIAEAKDHGEPPRAPIRLMTQFLKAVSESRMEDALALAQTSRRGMVDDCVWMPSRRVPNACLWSMSNLIHLFPTVKFKLKMNRHTAFFSAKKATTGAVTLVRTAV